MILIYNLEEYRAVATLVEWSTHVGIKDISILRKYHIYNKNWRYLENLVIKCCCVGNSKILNGGNTDIVEYTYVVLWETQYEKYAKTYINDEFDIILWET